MSDDVYTVNPGLNGLIPKQNEDTIEGEQLQISLHDMDETHIHFEADCPDYIEWHRKEVLRAYKLGASVERDNLSESIDEYLELGTQEHDLRSLYSFLEWHLGEGS